MRIAEPNLIFGSRVVAKSAPTRRIIMGIVKAEDLTFEYIIRDSRICSILDKCSEEILAPEL